MLTYMAGMLKVSNMIWVIFSLLALGLRGASVSRTGLLLGGNTELIVEGVVPDLLHVVPVGDDAVLHGVLEGEDTPLGLGLISNIGILLVHTIIFSYYPIKVKPHDRFLYQSKGRRINKDEDKKTWPSFFS
jgi:hypothetical protein